MSRGALFTAPLEFDLGASWCAGVIALLKSQSLLNGSRGQAMGIKKIKKKRGYLSSCGVKWIKTLSHSPSCETTPSVIIHAIGRGSPRSCREPRDLV